MKYTIACVSETDESVSITSQLISHIEIILYLKWICYRNLHISFSALASVTCEMYCCFD